MTKLPSLKPQNRGSRNYISQEMDYDTLTERLRKTLHYGAIPKSPANFHSSLSLTNVMVEKFSENDNLFLERLCFDYAADLSREAVLSPCSLVVALIYLERLSQKNPNFVSSIPSSKLFLVSVMIASKFLNDEGEDDEVFNPDWANSANIDLTELNQLERDFLQAMDWSLFVDHEEFLETLGRIETRVAQREGSSRGWLTYTDIEVLANSKLLVATWELVQSLVINVSLACLTAYLASVMTLFGSALVVSSLPWNQSKAPSTFVQHPTIVTSETPVQVSSNASSLGHDLMEMEVEGDISSQEVSLQLPSEILTLTSDIPTPPGTPGTSGFYPHLSDPPLFKTVDQSVPLLDNLTEPLVFVRPKKHVFFESIIPQLAIFHPPLLCLITA